MHYMYIKSQFDDLLTKHIGYVTYSKDYKVMYLQ